MNAPRPDIEQTDQLMAYMRRTGRIAQHEPVICRTLPGGVSNRTVLVERPGGEAWVVKQALAKLRVKEDWFCDPARIHREALALQALQELAPQGAIPRLIFEDQEIDLLAMEAVTRPHENWKTLLLSGKVDLDLIEQFAAILGTIHQRSAGRRDELETLFGDRSYFESLRLEPYYRFAASRHPEIRGFTEELITETLATRQTLVHGDYSPKNVLVREGRLVLLDYEVIHFGDPAFDVGFALTHLLSKAHHLPAYRAAFLRAAETFWLRYREVIGPTVALPVEERAVRHTLGCLLARVAGRSPLEYLSSAERERQRTIAIALMRDPPVAIEELFRDFLGRLAG